MDIMDDIRAIPSWMWLGGAAALGVILFLKARSSNSSITQSAPTPIDTSGSLLPINTLANPVDTSQNAQPDSNSIIANATPFVPPPGSIDVTNYPQPQTQPLVSSANGLLQPTVSMQNGKQVVGVQTLPNPTGVGVTFQGNFYPYNPASNTPFGTNLPSNFPSVTLFQPYQQNPGGPVVNNAPPPFGQTPPTNTPAGGGATHPVNMIGPLHAWSQSTGSNYADWVNQGKTISGGGLSVRHSRSKNIALANHALAGQVIATIGPALPVVNPNTHG